MALSSRTERRRPGPGDGWLAKSGRVAGRLPLTLVFLFALLVSAVVAALHPDLPLGYQLSGLRSGQWWTVFSGVLSVSSPVAWLTAVLLSAGLLGTLEYHAGSWRTLAIGAAGQLGALTLFGVLTQAAAQTGDGWLGSMVDVPLSGPWAMLASAGLAATAYLGPLWRRRFRVAILSVTAMLVAYVGHAATVFLLCGALIGLLLAWWLREVSSVSSFHRSTTREIRTIVAVVVAVFAVGPLAAALVRAPSGPLAIFRELVLNPIPTIGQLQSSCGDDVSQSCLQLAQGGGLGSSIGFALAVVPSLLLLVCAEGLRRGRRLALWLTVLIQCLVLAVGTVYLTLFAVIPHSGLRRHLGLVNVAAVHLLPIVLTPLAIVLLLLLLRRRFTVLTAARARNRFLLVAASSFVVLAAGYAAVWLAHDGWQRGGPGMLFAGLGRQFLPLPISPSLRHSLADSPPAEQIFFYLSGPLFWTVLLSGVLVLFWVRGSQTVQGRQERERARALVRRGGGSLSWMALWQNNHYWFSEDGKAGVAYQLHGGVALTLAGPFGEPPAAAAATAGFVEYCGQQGLIPCFYSVTDAESAWLVGQGFGRVQVAQETRLRLEGLEFVGKEWQNVRTAVNKAKKLGVTVLWSRYSELSVPLRYQLEQLSEDWAARKSMPEMGFTLGGLEELMDDEVLCALAIDDAGRLVGATSWLPVYRDGVVVSWTLDLMRRRADAFAGATEFLIASAILELRADVEVLSLSGSPLAKHAADESTPATGESPVLDRFLNLLGRAIEPVYGFRSLAHFKHRFKPEYRSLYLVYPDALDLPAIGNALSKAYLPGLSLRQTARLLRGLVRR